MPLLAPDLATLLAQVPGQPLLELERADLRLQQLRQGALPVPQVVTQTAQPLAEVDWDVLICGGTLGIMLAAALAKQGWRVALLERGPLRGRQQEWNTSRKELQVLLELELLNKTELETAIATEFNPVRVAIHEGPEIWVRDVLNVGVDPVYLLETLKRVFLDAGGKLLEYTGFEQAVVHPDGVTVRAGGQALTTRLLLDAMGYFSPIVAQARQGKPPDGICLVVGSCAQGIPANTTGDLFVSFTPIQQNCQYFWEAFPARDGRTTYLFTYTDPRSLQPTLTSLLNDYLALLPEYQQVSLEQLKFQRVLSGIFPSYRQPLRLPWERILAVGDSSGNQSPLSFGGFGAMLRHLQRLSGGIQSALQADWLEQKSLTLLQPYQPNLAVTWLFQQTMRVPPTGKPLAPEQINQLLAVVFATMNQLGEGVLLPFLQDVVQFPALTQTLLRVGWQHPGLVGKIVAQVGPLALATWLPDYLKLGFYTGLEAATAPLQPWLNKLNPRQRYFWQQQLQAWRYGSGGDYHSG